MCVCAKPCCSRVWCAQDEMIEISEREEQAAAEEKAAGEAAAHSALMKEANLDGVETLADDMVGRARPALAAC